MFAVILPVKPPARGKSRLEGVSDDVRRELAAAMALDTVGAALAADLVAEVLIVTDDPWFAVEGRAIGAATIPDGTTAGLNPTLRVAAGEVGRRWADLTPVALLGDLPALRSSELDEALSQVRPEEPAYVVDAAGTGTTLYVAPEMGFDPQFGVGSALLHATRAVPLVGELAGLRHDVDNLEDLRQVWHLGVGPRTHRRAAPLLGYGPSDPD
jgi:2-phospho-L-lactate guanylyltransferase